MGYTISGTVFYSIPLGGDEDEFEFPWDEDEEEWQDAWIKKSGIIRPTREMFESEDEYYKHLKPYWDVKHKLEEELNCDIDFAGYDGFHTYYILINESTIMSEWGSMEPVSVEVKPDWDVQLKHFCGFLGLPYSQPKWYVTCRMF